MEDQWFKTYQSWQLWATFLVPPAFDNNLKYIRLIFLIAQFLWWTLVFNFVCYRVNKTGWNFVAMLVTSLAFLHWPLKNRFWESVMFLRNNRGWPWLFMWSLAKRPKDRALFLTIVFLQLWQTEWMRPMPTRFLRLLRCALNILIQLS